jgi:hypothetical protein
MFLSNPKINIVIRIDEKLENLSDSLIAEPYYDEENKNDFIENVAGIFKFLFSTELVFINLNMIWSGISIAFYSSILIPIMCLQ